MNEQPPVVMFSKSTCPYCVKAKRLMDQKNWQYNIYDVVLNPAYKDAARELSGGRTTVPQIFFGQHHVGGCDDLYALESKGELEALFQSVEKAELDLSAYHG